MKQYRFNSNWLYFMFVFSLVLAGCGDQAEVEGKTIEYSLSLILDNWLNIERLKK